MRGPAQWCEKMAEERNAPSEPETARTLPGHTGLAGTRHDGRQLRAIGLRIARDGTWFYRGSPIGRPAMVKLFARFLRRDDDGYRLVTPREIVAVEVEDAPFVAVEMDVGEDTSGPVLRFRTNVDEWIAADAEHPLRFEPGASDGVKPYVRVREELWALLARPVVYDLLARGEIRDIAGRASYGVASAEQFFVIAPAEVIEGLQ